MESVENTENSEIIQLEIDELLNEPLSEPIENILSENRIIDNNNKDLLELVEECQKEIKELKLRVENLECKVVDISDFNYDNLDETEMIEEITKNEHLNERTFSQKTSELASETVQDENENSRETSYLNDNNVLKDDILYNENMKKVLICFIGNLDNSNLTWDKFKTNVKDKLGENADMCLCVGAKSELEFKNNPYFINSIYKWIYHEPSNWLEVYEYISKKNGNSLGILAGNEFIRNLDRNFGNSLRNCFYYWYLREKIEELKLMEKYEYFYITNASFLHEVEFISMEELKRDFYVFETKGNNNISFENIITSYSKISLISEFLINVFKNNQIKNEISIVNQGNITKLNFWYLTKIIGVNNIGYISPSMYKVYSEIPYDKKIGFQKNKEGNFYFENTIYYLNVKKLVTKPEFRKNQISHVDNKEMKSVVINNKSPTPVFKKNTKGSLFVRPPRKR